MYPEKMKTSSKKYMHPKVHSSTIYNSQNMVVSIYRWINKEYVCACSVSRVRLCNLVNWSPPGSSVHGIFQVRILEWVATAYSKGRYGKHMYILTYIYEIIVMKRSFAATRIDLKINHTKGSTPERSKKKTNFLISLTCGLKKKKSIQMNLKQRDSQT